MFISDGVNVGSRWGSQSAPIRIFAAHGVAGHCQLTIRPSGVEYSPTPERPLPGATLQANRPDREPAAAQISGCSGGGVMAQA
jgi:hypothetical protein